MVSFPPSIGCACPKLEEARQYNTVPSIMLGSREEERLILPRLRGVKDRQKIIFESGLKE